MYIHDRCAASTRSPDNEQGQIAILGAVLIALLLAMVVAIAVVGQAVIERSNATLAADAIALASVTDPAAHQQVADWYRNRGFAVDSASGRAAIAGDQAQARSYADADSELRVAPAVVAVLARASQLIAHDFDPVRTDGIRVVLSSADAAAFAAVAADLGMCRSARADELPGGITYELC